MRSYLDSRRVPINFQRMQWIAGVFAVVFVGCVLLNLAVYPAPGSTLRLGVAVVFLWLTMMLWGYATIRRCYGTYRQVMRDANGFTLPEMLLVLSIAAILIGLSLPMLGAMRRDAGRAAAVSAVSAATNAAHIYNDRLQPTDKDAAGFPPYPIGANHSGTAALFTPSGKIRLVVNDQGASRVPGSTDPADYLEPSENGYRDIGDLDYVTIPSGGAVAGVIRTGSGLEMVPPPFAVGFTSAGHLAMDGRAVVYDANYDGAYNSANSRPSNYDPDAWNGRLSGGPALDATTGRYPLPFEHIETVTAVLVYDAGHFRDAGLTWADGDAAARRDWFLENGRAINFSPLTGLAITGE